MLRHAATCGLCEQPIYIDLDGALPAPTLVQQLLEAEKAHLRQHPAPLLALYWLRKSLTDLPLAERTERVRQVYLAVRGLRGDEDCRGVYTVDEALGNAALYHFWLSADRCSRRDCRHEPAS